MSAVLVSLIAVAGTLLGSLTTYLFQRQTARHTEATARAERLRQDRRVAYGDFIAAVTEVKRAVITAWFRRDTKDFDASGAALAGPGVPNRGGLQRQSLVRAQPAAVRAASPRNTAARASTS